MKAKVIDTIKDDLGQIDLVVYSLRRRDAHTLKRVKCLTRR